MNESYYIDSVTIPREEYNRLLEATFAIDSIRKYLYSEDAYRIESILRILLPKGDEAHE